MKGNKRVAKNTMFFTGIFGCEEDTGVYSGCCSGNSHEYTFYRFLAMFFEHFPYTCLLYWMSCWHSDGENWQSLQTKHPPHHPFRLLLLPPLLMSSTSVGASDREREREGRCCGWLYWCGICLWRCGICYQRCGVFDYWLWRMEPCNCQTPPPQEPPVTPYCMYASLCYVTEHFTGGRERLPAWSALFFVCVANYLGKGWDTASEHSFLCPVVFGAVLNLSSFLCCVLAILFPNTEKKDTEIIRWSW